MTSQSASDCQAEASRISKVWGNGILALQQPTPQMNIGIILTPGFSILDLSAIVEVLKNAATMPTKFADAEFNWEIVHFGATSIESDEGIAVSPTADPTISTQFDHICIVGDLAKLSSQGFDGIRQKVSEYILRAIENGTSVAGIRKGVFTIAELGLLDGGCAAVNPCEVKEFQARFPNIPADTEKRAVQHGGITTVPGGISVYRYAAGLIAKHHGMDDVRQVLQWVDPATYWIRGSLPGGSQDDVPKTSLHLLSDAIDYMERNVESSLNVGRLAEGIGVSRSQVGRIFKEHTGMSPKSYWRSIRLNKARKYLLETDQSITELAYEIGYSDCAHFIREFKNFYGISPGRYRSDNGH